MTCIAALGKSKLEAQKQRNTDCCYAGDSDGLLLYRDSLPHIAVISVSALVQVQFSDDLRR